MQALENINIFYWILGVFAIGLTIKNIQNIKGYNREREYANTYSKILRQDEDAYEAMENFIAVEKNETLKNKAKVILIYEKMTKGENPVELAKEVNYIPMFRDKAKFSPKLANRNSDVFVWLCLVYAKAKSLSMLDVIDELSKKLNAFDEDLENQLEYKLTKAAESALGDKDENKVEFLAKLLEGDYAGMVYEQRLIGLYKRIAASYQAYLNKPVDEFFENDLHDFAETLVGKCLMADLGIIEKYPPIKKEENKELTEENKAE